MGNMILRLCDSCKFYNDLSDSCKAFPDGIPIRSDDPHFDVLPNQEGETVYELDKDKYDEFDLYRRIHPDIRFPLFITYDIPEPGEGLDSIQAEVETP